MGRVALVAFAAILVAPAAAAEEAPPPKPEAPARHENKVTSEAKAAFEAWQKLLYRPTDHGLKELAGTVEMRHEMAGMEGMGGTGAGMPDMTLRFAVSFRAPATMEVAAKGNSPMFPPQAAEGMGRSLKSLLLNALGVFAPEGDDAEYDAEVAAEEGRKVLVVTTYEKGARQGAVRFTLDDRGLAASGAAVFTEKGPGGSATEVRARLGFEYAKEGDRFLLVKKKVEISIAPAPFEYAVEYADAGGFRIPVKTTTGMQGMNMVYRFADLTVNGKKVDLPAAKGPEGKAPAAPGKAGKMGDPDGDDDGDDEKGGDDR